jgi:hypothetical protein
MARVQEHKDVGATKSTKDTKLKNTKTMRPLDAPPKAGACGTRPACAQADPSSGHGFVNFVLFVPFVAPDLRALDQERRE